MLQPPSLFWTSLKNQEIWIGIFKSLKEIYIRWKIVAHLLAQSVYAKLNYLK